MYLPQMGKRGHSEVHTPEKGLRGPTDFGLWGPVGPDAAPLRGEPEDRPHLHHQPAQGGGQHQRPGTLLLPAAALHMYSATLPTKPI
jgi:hypothetical protein